MSRKQPNEYTLKTLTLVYEGQYDLFGEELIRKEYEKPVRKLFKRDGKLYDYCARNIGNL